MIDVIPPGSISRPQRVAAPVQEVSELVQRLVELVPLGVVVYGRDDLGGILRRQRSKRVVAVPEDIGIVALVESGFGK